MLAVSTLHHSVESNVHVMGTTDIDFIPLSDRQTEASLHIPPPENEILTEQRKNTYFECAALEVRCHYLDFIPIYWALLVRKSVDGDVLLCRIPKL